ncbi:MULTISPECIES: YolD-like family protein [Peribacillus]|uniref:YolD-like family protein n=1 Tax=Peribacillus TaxID=2675229 RepID=UPI0019146B90|nr:MULTISPECIES: YolD-like family protein [unclassified Peribacillus]MBK5441741.1 YolD-like family protein [Peribacillus sp. TH24]WMX53337.1 YolD-like family protein [Peribacillus sp. R9-11]
MLLSESLEEKTLLNITTWKDGYFSSRIGSVTKLDPYEKKIFIQDELDSEITLNFFNIVDVKNHSN